MSNMHRPEIGKVFSLGTVIAKSKLPAVGASFLGDSTHRSIGGGLESFYREYEEGASIRIIAERVLRELRYRPTGRPDHSWYNLQVSAWRPTEQSEPEGVSFVGPVGEDDRPRDHALLRSMSWAYLALEGQVTIKTTDETHEPPGEVVITPGEVFLAPHEIREFAVDIPVDSMGMELGFAQHYDRTALQPRGLRGTHRTFELGYSSHASKFHGQF